MAVWSKYSYTSTSRSGILKFHKQKAETLVADEAEAAP
jgi:predicted small integral membrane protein